MKFARFCLLACLLALPGCSLLIPGYKPPLSLPDTVKFYHATDDIQRAPNPDCPLLFGAPKRKYSVIGHFTMRSRRYEYGFLRDAALYNGRMHGADAVILLDRWVTEKKFYYFPHATEDDYGPAAVDSTEKSYIDAEMIVYQ